MLTHRERGANWSWSLRSELQSKSLCADTSRGSVLLQAPCHRGEGSQLSSSTVENNAKGSLINGAISANEKATEVRPKKLCRSQGPSQMSENGTSSPFSGAPMINVCSCHALSYRCPCPKQGARVTEPSDIR